MRTVICAQKSLLDRATYTSLPTCAYARLPVADPRFGGPLLHGAAVGAKATRRGNDRRPATARPTTRTAPQCSDGRDNDGDGKIDYPDDPGCFAPNQDDETDDCPTARTARSARNGKDDDMNGSTDYPGRSAAAASASDTDEYTENPVACGNNVHIKKLPPDGHIVGTLGSTASTLSSPTCGGRRRRGRLRAAHPRTRRSSSRRPTCGTTTADTVLYIRGADCTDTHRASSPATTTSRPRDHDVDAHCVDRHAGHVLPRRRRPRARPAATYDLHVEFLVGEGDRVHAPATTAALAWCAACR